MAKYLAILIRKKNQLWYFHEDMTIFKTKVLVSQTKIYEFFEKYLSNVTYDGFISHFAI